jgi:fibronectin-binding autotransporter adhesin
MTAESGFNSFAFRGDYQVAPSTTNVINIPGTLGLNNSVGWTMGAGSTLTINANLASNATEISLVTGPGTVFLTGNNASFGVLNISAGATVDVSSVSNLPGATTTMLMNQGTLRTAGSLTPETHDYTFNGTGTINTNGFDSTFSGSFGGAGGFTKAGAGLLVMSGTSVTYAGATTVNAGTLRLDAANLTSSSSVTVTGVGSKLVLPSNATNQRMIRTGAVSATTGGQINIDDNKMIVTGAGATGTWDATNTIYTGVTGLVASGRNGTAWNGAGIVTSQTQAAGSNYTAIGVALASDVRPATATATGLWGGQTITGTDTLVMYTYGGDATLDGKINIDDYVKIDSGISAQLTGWSNGDFNYDGKVSIDDYITVIDANIGNQSGVFPTSGGIIGDGGGISGVSAVPEPASLSIIALTALGALRRQRRRPRAN